MTFLKKIAPVLLIVTALSVGVVGPAAAAPTPPQAPALVCNAEGCQLAGEAVGLLGVLLDSANLAMDQLPFERTADGDLQARLNVSKDITFALPVGDVTLSNADLEVEVGEDGTIQRLRGTADMPFPTFGLFDDTRIVTPARAEVGLDLGKNLAATGLELDPERSYLFFNADSAMDVAARTPGNANELALSFVPGQRAMLVIDTVEPVAYLNGQVTLAGLEQIGLLGGVLEGTGIGPYVPDTLPLRERTQFGLSGKFSKDVAESELTLSGGYTLDGGALPARLGLEAQPIQLLGTVSLSRDGVLVDGVVSSTIEPDTVFDGGAHLRAFVPFGAESGPGYAMIDGNVKIPAAKIGAGAGAKLGDGGYELRGQLETPFTDEALAGEVSGDLPDVAGAVGSAAGAVGSAAGTAADFIGPVVGEAAGTVGTSVGKAAGAVGSAAGGAAGFIGPVVGKAAGTVGDYAQRGLGFAGSAINAGKARLNRNATPTPTPTPAPTAP